MGQILTPSSDYDPETSSSCVEPKTLSDYRSFLMRELPKLVREQLTELLEERLEEMLQDLTPLRQEIETAVTAALHKALPEPDGSLAQESCALPATDSAVATESFLWNLDSPSFDHSPFDGNIFEPCVDMDLLIPYLQPSSTWSANSSDGSVGAISAAGNVQQVNDIMNEANSVREMHNDG